MTRAVEADGVSVDLPAGWEARVRSRPLAPAAASPTVAAADDAPAGGVVLHAGSFALPPVMGDYGSGAVEVMTAGDVLLCLLEHDPADAETPLFRREGIPAVRARDFGPSQMQRAIPGMAGAQWFFRVGARSFCLYAVMGSHRARHTLAPRIDSVVRTLAIT
ncbi:MAG: hypothetical protein ABL966_07370 [Acidimicrobiales bacterium]